MSRLSRTLTAAVAAAATLGALAACAPPADDTAPTSLTIAIPPPIGLSDGNASPYADPNLLSVTLTWMPVYESLIVWNPTDSRWDPWLAEEFSISEDRKTLSLKLREDVDFVDGVHFDAEGLATYLTDLYADPTSPQKQPDLLPVFTATGEYALEITTEAPITDQFFGQVLAYTPVVSPDAIDDKESLVTKPVGTGPYTLEEVTPGVEMSFVRNPDYWNPDAFDFDTVTFKVFADGIAAFNALRSGQVDITPIVPGMAKEAEAAGYRLSLSRSGHISVWMPDITGSIIPALADVRVRRAVAMAIDQAAIIEAVSGGYGETGSQIFTRGQPEYVEGGDDRYSYDLDEARALMAEAGYEEGFDVTIPTVAGFVPEEYRPIVQQALSEIGITVTYEPVADMGVLVGEWQAKTVAMFILDANYNLLPDALYGTGSIFPTFAEDPGYLELKEVVDTGTLDESLAASAEVGEYILDQAWIAPITQKVNIWASDPSVRYIVNNLDFLQQLRNFLLVD